MIAWALAVTMILTAVRVQAQQGPAASEAATEPAASEEPAKIAQPVVVGQLGADGRPAPVVAARPLTLTERLLLRQQWMQYREHDRRAVRITGPVISLVLGLGAFAFSTWLLAQDEIRERRAGGVLAGVVSAPVIAVSTWVLTKRVRRRRAIEREIWDAPPVSAGPFSIRF